MFGRFSEHRERRPRERERHRRYFPAGKDGWTNVQRVSAEKSAIAGKTSEREKEQRNAGGKRKERATPGQGEISLTGTTTRGERATKTGNSGRVRYPHLPVPFVPFTGCRSASSRSRAVPIGTRTASDRSPAFRNRGRQSPTCMQMHATGERRVIPVPQTRPRVAGLSLRSCGEILPSDEEARRAQRAGGVSVAFLKAGKHEDGRGCRVGRPTSEIQPTDLTW